MTEWTEDKLRDARLYGWRVKDGQLQERVKSPVRGTSSYGAEVSAGSLLMQLKELEQAGWTEIKIEVDHKSTSHPDYDCDIDLVIRAFVPRTDRELAKLMEKREARARTERLAEKRRLEAELARLNSGA